MLGANGSGKTTTLRALAGNLPALASAEPQSSVEEDHVPCTFFVRVTDGQLTTVLGEWLAAQAGAEDQTIGWDGPQWPDDAVYRPSQESEGVPPMRRWIETLRCSAGEDARLWTPILPVLQESRILSVSRRSSGGEYALAWCLDQKVASSDDVRPHLERLGFAVAARGQANDGAPPLSAADAPLPVAPLPTTRRTMLPTAVGVPRDLDEVRAELREAVVDLLVHLRWAERDHWGHGRGLPVLDAPHRSGTKAWLADPESESTTVNPRARGLCRLASHLATAVAPAFVSTGQAIEIVIEPIHRWERGGPRLEMLLRRSRGDVVYPMTAAADGHKVWVQLSVLEAVAVLRRFLDLLDRLLERAVAREAEDRKLRRERNPDWASYTAAVDLLDRFAEEEARPSGALAQFLALRNVGHRLYLIDEPEQHLHPRLQRSAARWLAQAGTGGASQCIVVTHSPHYLRVPGDVTFAYLQQRVEGQALTRTEIRELTPEALAASDAVAEQMGFDHGELLSAVSLVLFVEGEADKRCLEAFCGRQLHHAGIALVPIHGAVAAHKKGIVDSETVLVWTTAKLAILLDNLTEAEWQALQADSEYCRQQARKGSKTEMKAMAEILVRARDLGREIAPVGIPVPDIFDLLDDQLLCERFPKFPGHQAARLQWEQAVSKQPINWKAFYRDRYDIAVEPALFGEVAEAMAAMAARPPELDQLVRRLEELAVIA